MAQVKINPGICGFHTVVTVTADEDMQVQVAIESGCPAVAAMQAELQGLDGYGEVLGQWGSSTISKVGAARCTHAACPVPSGIIKGVEVACGLALPAPVTFDISK